jgi:hypothetical protein
MQGYSQKSRPGRLQSDRSVTVHGEFPPRALLLTTTLPGQR